MPAQPAARSRSSRPPPTGSAMSQGGGDHARRKVAQVARCVESRARGSARREALRLPAGRRGLWQRDSARTAAGRRSVATWSDPRRRATGARTSPSGPSRVHDVADAWRPEHQGERHRLGLAPAVLELEARPSPAGGLVCIPRLEVAGDLAAGRVPYGVLAQDAEDPAEGRPIVVEVGRLAARVGPRPGDVLLHADHVAAREERGELAAELAARAEGPEAEAREAARPERPERRKRQQPTVESRGEVYDAALAEEARREAPRCGVAGCAPRSQRRHHHRKPAPLARRPRRRGPARRRGTSRPRDRARRRSARSPCRARAPRGPLRPSG